MRFRAFLAARLLAIWCAAANPVGAAQSSPKPAPRVSVPPAVEKDIRSALDAYAAGDDAAAARWRRGLKEPAAVAFLEPVILKSGTWSRSHAAFVLEAAIAVPLDGRTAGVLAAGRSMVMKRPAAFGANPLEDQFEVLWHESALAVLQASPWFWVQQEYLDGLGSRLDDAEQRGLVPETRLPLARAIAAASLCCFKRVPGEAGQPMPSLSRGVTLDAALGLFKRAGEIPRLRREALIRGAKLLYESGRHEEALAWFDAVSGEPDSGLEYVHLLTRGRVLDALNRPDDAGRAYAAALSAVPNGQLAAIGRAAALLRSGREEDAAAIAADARRMPAGRADFDRLRAFNLADVRFIAGWLTEIRRLRR